MDLILGRVATQLSRAAVHLVNGGYISFALVRLLAARVAEHAACEVKQLSFLVGTFNNCLVLGRALIVAWVRFKGIGILTI